MKKIIFLLAVVSFLLSACNQEPPVLDFPSYTKVVKKFASKYSLNADLEGYIVFQKCPEGWYVAVKPYDSDKKIKKRKLFWELESREFNSVKYDKITSEEDNKEMLENLLNNSREIFLYELNPYYGYTDYEKDIIDFLGKYKKLSEDQLYSLGRAYTSYASNLLYENLGSDKCEDNFKLPFKKESMSKEQLNTYKEAFMKGVKTFEKLAEINPEYGVLIGDINTKISNDYMTAFIDLWIFHNEKEAMSFIDNMPVNYSPLMLSYARNHLKSCEKNAILFTNGDNDTYPLLYLQAKENYRTDVLVVNTSLLNIARYATAITDGIFDSNPLKTTLSSKEFRDDELNLIYIDRKNSNESFSMDYLLKFVADENNKYTAYSNEYKYFPTSKYYITLADSTDVTLTIDKSFLNKSELILLDIISNNNNRKIYFSNPNTPYNLGFKGRLNNEGLVQKICFSEKEINYHKLYDNVMKNYDMSWVNKDIGENEKQIASVFRSSYGYLGLALANKGSYDSAKVVMKEALKLLPDKKLYYDGNMTSFMLAYSISGEHDKVDQIAEKLMSNLNSKKTNHNSYIKKNEDLSGELDYQKKYLNRLLQYCNRPQLEADDSGSLNEKMNLF